MHLCSEDSASHLLCLLFESVWGVYGVMVLCSILSKAGWYAGAFVLPRDSLEQGVHSPTCTQDLTCPVLFYLLLSSLQDLPLTVLLGKLSSNGFTLDLQEELGSLLCPYSHIHLLTHSLTPSVAVFFIAHQVLGKHPTTDLQPKPSHAPRSPEERSFKETADSILNLLSPRDMGGGASRK